MEKRAISRFGSMLRKLLDDTSVLRRAEWAQILGVSEAAISQWVNDQVLPRPENLRAIYTTLFADRRVADEILEAFNALAGEPASQLSPHGDRMSPTVAHYMLRPLRDGFLRTLDTLPPSAQEQLLLDAARRARDLRRGPSEPMSVAEQRRAAFEDLVTAAKRPRGNVVTRVMKDAAWARRGSSQHCLGAVEEGLRSVLDEAKASGNEVVSS
jgi:hypothetical protein